MKVPSLPYLKVKIMFEFSYGVKVVQFDGGTFTFTFETLRV